MKITIDRSTVEQALKALEAMQSYAAAERKGLRICDEAITALKAALAEPVQEPVYNDLLRLVGNLFDDLFDEAYKAGKSDYDEVLGLRVAAYDAGDGVHIVACNQRDGSRLWAVRDESRCVVLNKLGEWEYEPSPSSRDDAFLVRCRYATPLEARDAYMAFLTK
jgi:hypothetical protein